MLNSREMASVILLGPTVIALTVWLLSDARIRSATWALIKAVLSWPAAIAVFLAYYACLVGAVYLAWRLGAWEQSLLPATVIWMAGTGLGLLWSMKRARDEPRYFLTGLRNVFAATLLVELFFQLQTFPLAVELVVQPVMAVLVLGELAIRSSGRGSDPDGQRALGCLSRTIAGAGFLFAVATVILVIRNWGDIDWRQQGLAAAMLVWLTAVALPFVYVCSRLVFGPSRR